jgi:hypothetical protein
MALNLTNLRRKFRERRADRKRHLRLAKKTGKRGYRRAATRDGRAMRKLRALIAKAIHARRGTLAGVRVVSTSSGRPHWGGAADVMGQFAAPFMQKRGLPKGSGKRTPQHNAEIGGSPTSDHLTTKLLTFARDFPTFAGEDDARALARAFGIATWQPNSYTTYDVVIDGWAFRIQILWGAGIGHGDHVHVGISLVGRA